MTSKQIMEFNRIKKLKSKEILEIIKFYKNCNYIKIIDLLLGS